MQKRKLGKRGLEVGKQGGLNSQPQHIRQVVDASLKRCK